MKVGSHSARLRAGRVLAALLIGAAGLAVPTPGAASPSDDLRQRIEAMEKMLQSMKSELEATKKKAEEAQKQAKQVKRQARKEARKAAEEANDSDIKFHFGSTVAANYTASSVANNINSFGDGLFAPIFLVDYKDLLQFKGHLEFTTNSAGGTATSLEYANLNLFATDWLTLTAGKYLTPIGDFQTRQHPAWMNKLPDRPAGFVEDGGIEPLTDIGITARGAFPVGSMTADYAVFVGNGPRIADAADDGLLLEGRTSDDNGDKAVGGRVAIHPIPSVTFGLSAMRSAIKGNAGTGGTRTDGDFDLEIVDAAYVKDNLNLRGEYIRAHLDSLQGATATTSATQAIAATDWHAWYLQASYRLAGLTDNSILRNVEPVVRYSHYAADGEGDFEAKNEDRWTVGLDYWFAPSIVAKVAYENRDFHLANLANQDVFRAQMAFGF